MPKKPKTKKPSFYAVHRGRATGVFPDWATVQPLVSGFSNPIQKKFKTRIEAEYFVEYGIPKIPKTKKDPDLSLNFSDLMIFTDGSADPIKTKKAALGIAFGGTYNSYNYSEQLYEGCTNQLAELYAIAKALEILTDQIQQTHNIATIEIWTDSKYSLDCVGKWYDNWIVNGWFTTSGDPVKYQKYIEYIHQQLVATPNCRLRHIKELNLKRC